ncbi:MAG: hypothetical protein O7H40_16820, partial [Gammaproteobacteria bacterium]|nr:hypothetical protein [Gammaproteobacteria bacterium]
DVVQRLERVRCGSGALGFRDNIFDVGHVDGNRTITTGKGGPLLPYLFGQTAAVGFREPLNKSWCV